jgi:hypothetical protein
MFARNNWPMRNLANKANSRFCVVLDEISVDIAVGQTIADDFESSLIDFGRSSKKSYDPVILVSVAIVAIVLVVATYALTVSSSGFSPNELGSMTVYP